MKDIKFDKKKHTYTMDGEQLLSVTTFVKQHFPPFDSKNISKYVGKAQGKTPGMVRKEWKEIAELGTKVHKEIEEYLIEHKIPHDNKAMNAIMYLKQSYKEVLFLPEVIVGSKELGIAGTIDLLILSIDEEGKIFCTMIDWKTNSKIKVSGGAHGLTSDTQELQDNHLTTYSLQMSTYKVLVEETLGLYIDNMFILHLEDGDVTEIPAVDYTLIVQDMIRRYNDERKRIE